MHGGDSGEINQANSASETTDYIFEKTLAENRATETQFTLPNLEEVILLTAKRLLLNIEVKVPISPELKQRYRWQKAVRTLL